MTSLRRQQADKRLTRLGGCGIGLLPDARRRQRHIQAPAVQGDLGGAAGDARIVRFPGKFKIKRGRIDELSALSGNLGQQKTIEQLGCQFDSWQARSSLFRFSSLGLFRIGRIRFGSLCLLHRFGSRLLRKRGATSQQHCDNKQGKDRLHGSGGRRKMGYVYNGVMLAVSHTVLA